jgi:AcrR family transcriptional regulator
MARKAGLRERKKTQTRQHIADTAARLFATHGYDQVSIADVAQAADVSDQTVYNYFPAKHDLVLDRADEILQRYSRTVLERPSGTSPAAALRVVAHHEIERHRRADLDQARGELPALSVSSPAIHRLTLQARDQQAEAVAAAITETNPAIHPAVARAHAAALISIFQMAGERIGRGVLDRTAPDTLADELVLAAEAVFDDLDQHFQHAHGPRSTA